MSRAVEEWRGKTDDTPAPPRVRARVFAAHDGRCHRTGRKIQAGEAWELDHVVALINGGENRESNLAPILAGKPHREKTAEDVAIKAKTARMKLKHLGVWPKTKAPLRGRGFSKSRLWPASTDPSVREVSD
jgi:5-methylcytosine-specific restriction protein A